MKSQKRNQRHYTQDSNRSSKPLYISPKQKYCKIPSNNYIKHIEEYI
ncbi:hypothetical protein DERP_002943, partial [Dermatophagoides pteronyssinus]